MSEALDFLGNKIEEGATIVYPVRQGSSMWLNKRKVAAVVKTPDERLELSVYDPDTAAQRATRIKNLNTCVVVAAPAAA